jgi:hypothetical protein
LDSRSSYNYILNIDYREATALGPSSERGPIPCPLIPSTSWSMYVVGCRIDPNKRYLVPSWNLASMQNVVKVQRVGSSNTYCRLTQTTCFLNMYSYSILRWLFCCSHMYELTNRSSDNNGQCSIAQPRLAKGAALPVLKEFLRCRHLYHIGTAGAAGVGRCSSACV